MYLLVERQLNVWVSVCTYMCMLIYTHLFIVFIIIIILLVVLLLLLSSTHMCLLVLLFLVCKINKMCINRYLKKRLFCIVLATIQLTSIYKNITNLHSHTGNRVCHARHHLPIRSNNHSYTPRDM